MTEYNDPDLERDPNNDAPAPAAGALTSLAALSTALNNVDTASVIGRSGKPMMQFKSRTSDGTWMFGQKRTVPEDGSRWAVNPVQFKWGFVSFDAANKATERLVSVFKPKPDPATLPDTGFPWNEQWTADLKCLDGADAGVEVTFKSTTDGGIKAVATMIEAIRDRFNGGRHDGKISPIVVLEKDSYSNSYGKQWTPSFTIVDWMSMDGPAMAQTPPPSPSPSPTAAAVEQPRRRRVG
jgi:hypothetical protein